MIIALLAGLEDAWSTALARELETRALVLRATDPSQAMDLLWSLPVSVLFSSLDPLDRRALEEYERLLAAAPQAVTVCLIAPGALDRVRHENRIVADFWLSTEATPAELQHLLTAALAQAAHRHDLPSLDSGAAPLALSGPEHVTPESALFRRLVPALSGGFDADRLLQTYVEAMAQFARCTTYCLLWRPGGEERLTVYACQGLASGMSAQGRLLASDELPRWYLHNSRVLTRAELAQWPDRRLASALAREMDVFRAKVVVPLLLEGRLAGLLLLGEKAAGGAYSQSELETLFIVSSYVALQLQSFALHAEISNSSAYMERILSGMGSGVVTLGRDGRIAVCNPYAAGILGLRPEELEGQDLRALPSPLGDYLYAAFLSAEDCLAGREVSIRGGALTLRVSTSHLCDDRGEPLGSVLLLEDMTAQIALVTERHRRERLDMLTQVVGSLAHEVRTPLTAVKTYAELAGVHEVNEDLRDFWQDTVSPQIDRLDALIGQLVELVQQPEPDFELVRLDELLQQALADLPLDGDTPPVVDVEIARPLPRVIADAAQTRQALVYLLHYLRGEEASPVQVNVGAQPTATGEAVVLTMERLKRDDHEVAPESLFDPLKAIREANGGLGPAISRTLIENQGGVLQGSYEHGRLAFHLSFPAPQLSAGPGPLHRGLLPTPPRPGRDPYPAS